MAAQVPIQTLPKRRIPSPRGSLQPAPGCARSARAPLRLRCLGLAISALLWLAAPVLGSSPLAPGTNEALSVRATSNAPAVAPGAEVFTANVVWRLRLEIGPAELLTLRQNRREYVRARVSEGSKENAQVGLHLKGARGSLRPLDDKPSFTLRFDRFQSDQRFHGLRKIHLNNSVEDPSYLAEKLGAEMFHRAGLPAPRVAHAWVECNGRTLGLFVLKEGFTDDLLATLFQRSDGNLYEPLAGQDVPDPMPRRWGGEPDQLAGLKTLAAAAQEPDLARRWQRLGAVLDTNRFAAFMALEVMLGHRDGYCMAKNNFRVYHDLDGDRMVFLPQGMDQLFGKAELPWRPAMAGLVARAWMETAEGQAVYRACFERLFTDLYHLESLTNWLQGEAPPLRALFRDREARAFDAEVARFKEKIAQRHADLARQLAQPEPTPPEFIAGVAPLANWRKVDEPEGGVMDRVRTRDARTALHIRAGPKTGASWRCRVLLPPGRYRFEGELRVSGVEALPFGKLQGAALRVTGQPGPVRGTLGKTEWQPAEAAFQVQGRTEEVELACELRARAGEAWFDLNSLRLRRAD